VTSKYDVVVIGTGTAASTVAMRCRKAGKQVLFAVALLAAYFPAFGTDQRDHRECHLTSTTQLV